MPVAYTCPHCHHAGRAPDHLAGLHATCPGCRNVFTVQPAPLVPPPPPDQICYPPREKERSAIGNPTVERIVRNVLWVGFLVVIGGATADFSNSWGRAANVMQQQAVAVRSCFYLMASFCLVYTLDRLLLGRR